MKTAITFSCDTNYFPLLKGTILSLEATGLLSDPDITLHLADVGCSAEDLAWAAAHNVSIVPFRVADYYRFPPETPDNQRYAALLYRGVIPELFPGHDVYLHIDADIWIQRREGVERYLEICKAAPDKAVVSPCRHFSYMSEYRDDPGNRRALYRGFMNLYGQEAGEVYCSRPVISAGMFAVARDHRLWRDWREHMQMSYGKPPLVEVDRGGSDQMTFNFLLQTELDFIPLDGAYNYNAHIGFPIRMKATDQVCIGFPPYQEIHVVHLTCFSRFKDLYMKYGLLFDMGRYLSDADRKVLKLT